MHRISKDLFVHLDVHSDYSGHGSCRIPDIVDKAVEFKMPAVALTDFNTLGGAVKFYTYAVRKGIKPIIGCSMTIVDGRPHEDSDILGVVLLATGPRGYGNLCRLVSSLADQVEYSNEAIDGNFFLNNCSGLICLAKDHSFKTPKRSIMDYYEVLGKGNLYLLTMPSYSPSRDIYDNKKLMAYSKRSGIPIVATNHVIFMSPDDTKVHEIHKCLMSGSFTGFKDFVTLAPVNQWYFQSAEKMRALLKDIPEAADATIEIAERCNFTFAQEPPRRPPVIGIRHKRKLEDILLSECRKGVKTLYSGKPTEEAEKRMEEELRVINALSLGEQFLFIKGLFDYARMRNILLMPDFPAAGTLIAYLLGIGKVNPLEHGLVFERHINLLRKINSIDMRLLCSPAGRKELLEYMSRKYGNMAIPFRYMRQSRNSGFEDALRREGLSHLEHKLNDLIISSVPDKAAIAIRPQGFRVPLPLENSNGPLPLVQFPIDSCERLGMFKLELMVVPSFSVMKKIAKVYLKTYLRDDPEIRTYKTSGVEEKT